MHCFNYRKISQNDIDEILLLASKLYGSDYNFVSFLYAYEKQLTLHFCEICCIKFIYDEQRKIRYNINFELFNTYSLQDEMEYEIYTCNEFIIKKILE